LNKNKVTFVIPDAHAPFHNVTSWRIVLDEIKRVKPTETIIIGDFADFYSVSKFSKDPSRKTDLAEEVDAINVMLYELEGLVGADVTFLEGNHEHRLESFLRNKAPELYGFFDIARLFKLGERGWKYVPYGKYHRKGKVTYVHDLGYFGKYAIARTLDAAQTNVVFGHTHRAGIAYAGNNNSGGGNFCMNVGCIIDINEVDYGHRFRAEREWTQGFGIVEESNNLAYAQFIPIVKGKALWRSRA
jgi:hypothetical protein